MRIRARRSWRELEWMKEWDRDGLSEEGDGGRRIECWYTRLSSATLSVSRAPLTCILTEWRRRTSAMIVMKIVVLGGEGWSWKCVLQSWRNSQKWVHFSICKGFFFHWYFVPIYWRYMYFVWSNFFLDIDSFSFPYSAVFLSSLTRKVHECE